MDYQKLIIPGKGRVCKAIYCKQQVPNYIGNPLIEALPRSLPTNEAIKKLAYYPDYNESMRSWQTEQRYQLLEDIVRFFTPLNIHIDLERRISRVIRTGYIERNPTKAEFWKKNGIQSAKANIDPFDQYGNDDDFHSTSAFGFNIVGVSGIGKSLTVERILRLFPQIIHHSKYNGQKFTYSQIVWLKLDCPFDGSIKGLCINFFQAVDTLLGTSYHKNYGTRSRNTDEMLPYMALVAANHGIGVLVIDEIQRLSLAQSGGIEKMLNFFVQIVNSVGIPVILVGTYKSLSVFDGNFSQLRRGTGQGDLVWDRMKLNNEWRLFVKALWYFQYTKKSCSLDDNPELADVLYEETQGITDLGVKAYMLAQERAIETGKEIVNSSVIRSVCRDKFRMLRPALEAIKSKTKNDLVRFDDAYPQFLEQYHKEVPKSFKSSGNSEPIQIVGEIASAPEIRQTLKKVVRQNKKNATDSNSKVVSNIQEKESIIKDDISNNHISEIMPSEFKEPILPNILNSIEKKTDKNIYETLKQAGFIRLGNEF